MSERLAQLEKMLAKEPNDAFLLYGIALEFKKIREPQRALDFLKRVVAIDSGYCYAYHQMGLIHESLDDLDAARQAYSAGVEAARKKGDTHALGEIEAALMMIE
jgi:Tfp pilus assembly protein PilF